MRTNNSLNKIFLTLVLGAFLLSSCGKPTDSTSITDSTSDVTSDTSSNSSGTTGTDTASNTSTGTSSGNTSTSTDTGNYYSTISSSATGTTLLTSLRSLNSTKRTRTVGYRNMGQYYKQTDGDPTNSNNIISFYSGTSAPFNGSFQTNFNREHVWPNSRGGSAVEDDIHVTRPTLTAENSSRGNSFYVQGMNSSSNGWDPGAVSWGDAKYRGIAARIIFYCVVANSGLKLVDLTNDSTGNKSMGKLSDLLNWNLQYEIDETEIQRNEAVITIQGNRNPFIDDPSYACKIWGSTNSTTKSICNIS